MTILIILLALFTIGILLIVKVDYLDYGWEPFIGIIISVVSGIYLIVHIIFWATASYDYKLFSIKRQAFVETLEVARKTNNPLEMASITKDVSEWNQELAERKYNLTVFLLKDYVDKRINDLEPIR